MSTVTSQYVISPTGESEICSCFDIGDVRERFTLFNVSTIGQEYTLSFWVKSSVDSSVTVNGSTFSSSTEWTRYTATFTAASTDLVLAFGSAGTHYIYHIQLELGNVATDWSVALADVEDGITAASDQARTAQYTADGAANRVALAEATIQVLSDCIKTLVRDASGESLMTQTGNGWSFSMGSYDKTLSEVAGNLSVLTETVGDTNSTVDILNQSVKDLGVLAEYVIITTYNGQPCIELGESDSNFKLRITNTEIQFVDGSVIPAYLSNQKLYIEQAEIKNELRFGDFVWSTRRNGNMGLMWKGGDL